MTQAALLALAIDPTSWVRIICDETGAIGFFQVKR